MSANTPIHPSKKTYAAVHWAVQKVHQANGYLINKMGGIIAVTGAILAAVTAFVSTTIGKAMGWIEDKLARCIPIVIGFLANQVGVAEKSVLRKVLEKLA
jgi:hypothetical protein